MSTPPFVDLPDRARAERLPTDRGEFAVHIAEPDGNARTTAVLVPGYTGSKEDFIALLDPLAALGIRVVAVDPRGQFETPGPDDEAAYAPAEQGADIAAVIDALDVGEVDLLGHSFGGLIARETAIAFGERLRSLTLLGSGPAAVPGAAADRVGLQLAALEQHDLATVQSLREAYMAADGQPEPPPEIKEFLRRRFIQHNRVGLIAVSKELLQAPDRVDALAAASRRWEFPVLVSYGHKDDAWPPDVQATMAARLGAAHAVIDGAGHSPAVDEPATTAAVLGEFWLNGAASQT